MTPLHGTIEVWFHDGTGPQMREAIVRSGSFELALPSLPSGTEILALGRTRLDDAEAYCEVDRLQVAGAHPMAIVARPLPRSFLRVVAADSGRELTRFELVESRAALHLGPHAFKVADVQDTPFEIPPWSDDSLLLGWRPQRKLWARAPGYSWGHVEIDMGSGREWLLELVPSGDLLIEAVPELSLDGRALHLVDAERPERSDRVVSLPGEPFVLENLRPGSYRILVEENARSPKRIATADVDVRAGEFARVLLEPDPAQPAESEAPVPLRGTLVVPDAWKVDDVRLHLQRWEAYEPESTRGSYKTVAQLRPQLSEADPERWVWDAGLQLPGAYLAIVQPFQLCHTFPRWPATEESTHIQVPEPAQVHVRLFDSPSQRPAAEAHLGWYGKPPPQPSGVTTLQVEPDPETGSFDFRAPVGEIVLVVSGMTYGLLFEPATVHPGTNEFEIRLDPKCKVEVQLMDGDRLVSPARVTQLKARPLAGVGKVLARERSGASLGLLLDQPGLWELSVVDLPEGYAATGPVQIEAHSGETRRCEIAVVRTR